MPINKVSTSKSDWKTVKPVIFEIVGFLSDMVLMIRNEFYDLQLVPPASFSLFGDEIKSIWRSLNKNFKDS